MEFNKENTLKIMEGINYQMVDIRDTIENADELNGEDSIYISDNENRMHSYMNLQKKRKYKSNFLSDSFFEIFYNHHIPYNGIFIALANGKTIFHDKDTPSEYIISLI